MGDDIVQRYRQVQSQIAAAAAAAGRPAAAIRLVAVSKTHPADALRAVYGLGQRDFGENYAQELATKADALKDLPDLRLEFIGTLQSNKMGLLVRHAAAIQSLASERHARMLARHVEEQGRAPYPVHLLVNAGDETSKSGLALGDVAPLARVIQAELPALKLRGLMAIPPPVPDPGLYKSLRDLASQVGDGELSLGMSGDLALAIASGSDCVRIGTAIFGARS